MKSILSLGGPQGFLLPILFFVLGTSFLGGQEFQKIKGGSIVWKGKKIQIPASEIMRHLSLVAILNPKANAADKLLLAWSRAIRLSCGQAENIEIVPAKFEKWMRDRHLQLRAELASAPNPAEAYASWVQKRGFQDRVAYENACREEYLGELFVALEFPEIDTDLGMLRKHFDLMFTAYDVSVVAFAPETVDSYEPLDPKNEANKTLFKSWWNSLPDAAKRALDDHDRPAIEAEVLYFLFGDKSVAQMKEFFERDRPEIGGSFQSLTAKYKLTDQVIYKMAMRWQQNRRSTMSRWNGEVPTGASEQDAFNSIQPHLERVWRLIKYLGDIWQEASAAGPDVDFKALAAKKGVRYRHVPMTPTRKLTGDKTLFGDHPLYMRQLKPGALYSYTSFGNEDGSIYYTNGVVDQPGAHAGVWRLIRSQEMRVRPADEMMAAAWDRFEEANKWRIAFERATLFRDELDRQVAAHIKQRKAKGPLDAQGQAAAEAEYASESFSGFFDPKLSPVKNAAVVPNLFIRPEDRRIVSPNYRGRLGVRVANYLTMGWQKIIGAPSTSLSPGQIIPMAFSHERRLGVLTRINNIHRPSEKRWKIDVAGKAAARRDLELGAQRNRTQRIRRAYAFPNIFQKFSIKAPHFERVMVEALMGKRPKQIEKKPIRKKNKGK